MASGNFCTWNALTGIKDDGSSGITFANGNTSASMTHNGISCLGTHGIKSGKWYYEINYHADGNYSDGRLFAGWTSDLKGIKYAFFKQAGGSPDREGFGVHVWFYRNGSQGGKISYQSGTDFTGNTGASNTNIKATQANDIIMCAIDADNHKMYWGINGNWGSTNTNGATATNSDITQVDGWSIESTWQGSTWQPAIWFAGASSGTTAIINAGQDSSFAGTKTSGSANASDSNSVGNFYYTPPTNFLALSSSNLVISDDIDPAQTDTDISEKQCGAVLYTGNGGSNAITGLGFQPDLVWMKQRSSGSTFSNGVVDSSRGASLGTYFNRTNADTDFSSDFSSFDNDGFTLASGSAANINNSGVTFIGWGWKANGGTTSSNSDGSITSSVQANTKAGFSIVTYTGGGSSGTVGHGLNKAPEFVISKKRSGTQSWYALATPFGQGYFNVSGNGSYSSGNDPFNSSAPTTTVVGASGDNVTSSATYIYYCWHSVEGFSKFSKFEGNGNADGAFVYTGFRPKMLVIKDGDNSERAWVVYDDKRNTFNPVKNTVGWNLNGSEDTSSYPVDFLSNGFKLRTTNNLVNASSTYFYACWGSVPFRYNNTF